MHMCRFVYLHFDIFTSYITVRFTRVGVWILLVVHVEGWLKQLCLRGAN